MNFDDYFPRIRPDNLAKETKQDILVGSQPVTIDPWAELKHAIRVYLTLTGGPSEALCLRLLKIPDFLDDHIAGRDSSAEMSKLAGALVREIGEGVLQKGEEFRNRPGLADTVHRLKHCLEWATGAPPQDAKRAILNDVSLVLIKLSEVTGEKYPQVPL